MKKIKGEFMYPSTRSMKGRSYPNLLFSEFLNESRLHDITKDFVDRYIKELYDGEYGDELHNHIEDFETMGYDDDIDYEYDDLRDTKEFKEWLRENIYNEYSNAMDRMWQIEENGKVVLYREMTITPKWIENFLKGKVKRLGEFWSYSDSPEHQWGKSSKYHTNKIVLVVEIDEKYIDWIDSLNRNIGRLQEEREITIDVKNAKLKLLKVFVSDYDSYCRTSNDRELDISNLKKRVYKP